MDRESTTEAVNKFKRRFTDKDAEATQTLLAPIAKTLEGISFKRASGRDDPELGQPRSGGARIKGAGAGATPYANPT